MYHVRTHLCPLTLRTHHGNGCPGFVWILHYWEQLHLIIGYVFNKRTSEAPPRPVKGECGPLEMTVVNEHQRNGAMVQDVLVLFQML